MTAKLSSAGNKINYHHEGEMHTLIITTRYTQGMTEPLAIDTLSELTKMTVRTWCEAWSAIKHNKDISRLHSAQERFEIADSLSEPYCTVWNMNNNGLTITVNSAEKPDYAVIAASAQKQAIAAIHESVKNAAKEKPPITGDKDAILNRLTEGLEDKHDLAPHEWIDDTNLDVDQSQTYLADFSNWKHAVFMPDGSALLPMKKDNEVRMAIRADKQIDYDKTCQYEDEQIVIYPFGTIKRATVGKNNLPVISIITGNFGILNIFCYKTGSEDKTYDYETIITYFKRVGIDAIAPNFAVEYNAQVAIKIAHGENKKGEPIEYKNVYGFWNNPV